MTRPHIEPMSRGALPTEPGWYVMQTDVYPTIVEVRESRGRLEHFMPGWEIGDKVERGQRFIARIFPDRIAARAQALLDLAAMDGETL